MAALASGRTASANVLAHAWRWFLQMVNKLLYRSKQRGFLELDLLVGLWAEREIPKMSSPMLADMSTLLDEVRAGRSWASLPF